MYVAVALDHLIGFVTITF